MGTPPPLEEWGSALIHHRDTKNSIRDRQAQVRVLVRMKNASICDQRRTRERRTNGTTVRASELHKLIEI